MRSPRAKIVASLGALAVILGAGSYGTFAAFTDTTSNGGNSFSAGTLNIQDDDGTQLAFNVSTQRPGDTTGAKCINVTNSGTLEFGSLNFYGTVGGTGLAPYLTVDVDRGTGATGGSSFSCTNFAETSANIVSGLLSAFPTAGSPIVEAGNTWPAGQTRSYRITVTLPSSVTDANAEGKSATLTLNWDATS